MTDEPLRAHLIALTAQLRAAGDGPFAAPPGARPKSPRWWTR